MFEALEYIYMPSRDVAADVAWFSETLGAEVVFAIDGMGTRVAMLRVSAAGPPVLLADHVEGDAPFLVYRVADLGAAVRELRKSGWRKGRRIELPMGAAFSFAAPGGQRVALFELSRPQVVASFAGRRDF
jgi:hypothetical protein